MKNSSAALVAIAAFAGCGSPSQNAGSGQETQLKLLVSDTPIVLQAGQSLALQLLVIGTGSDQVSISSPDLPPFATLHGTLLTLSPGRQYEGDYELTLIAEAGERTATAALHVNVTRYNTPPEFEGRMLLSDANGLADSFCAVVGNCTLHGVASIFLHVKDADGDIVTAELEVVPAGQAFSGKPTHGVTAPVGVDHNDGSCYSAYDAFHACIQISLPDLVTGHEYVFAVRMRDALGATATQAGSVPTADGWYSDRRGYRFLLAP